MTKMEILLGEAVKQIISLTSESEKCLYQDSYNVQWYENVEKGRSVGRNSIKTRNTFEPLYHELKDEIELLKQVKEFRAYIEEFSSESGQFIPLFSRQEAIKRQVEIIFNSYFSEVGSLDLNKKAVKKVCNSFKEEVSSNTALLVSTSRIRGFEAEKPFDLEEGITFRPITMSDIEKYGFIRRYDHRLPYNETVNLNDWVCEVRLPINKANSLSSPDISKELTCNNFHHLSELIADSLSLILTCRSSIQLMYRAVSSPYINIGTTSSGMEVHTARHSENEPEAVIVNQEQVKNLQKIYKKLKAKKSSQNYTDLSLALRRLRTAAGRQDLEDQIVDCVIGMEYLLAPDGKEGETTYKCRIRGAALLPDEFGNMEERKTMMGKLYTKRRGT